MAYSFFLNLPICGVALTMIVLFVDLSMEKVTLRKKLAHVDCIGGILFIGSTTSFLVGLSFGGVDYPWKDYHTIAPLLSGTAGLAFFALYEGYFARNPFLLKSLFNSWSAIVAYVCAALQGLIVSRLSQPLTRADTSSSCSCRCTMYRSTSAQSCSPHPSMRVSTSSHVPAFYSQDPSLFPL